jgi:uncharacterized MAPEG superfamily protein
MPLSTPGLEALSVLFAGFLVWLSALIQHFSNILERGARYVMSDRSVAPAVQGFFGRATRTLSNNIESALMYAPAVLVLILLERTNALTALAAMAYIGARGVFLIAYWLNVPVIRSVAWLAGMVCCAAMMVSVALISGVG